MTASLRQTAQAPDFPLWPFDCLSLYTRMMRDVGDCAEAVSRSSDAMDAVRAEADFGVKLWSDLVKGYYDLALAPWTAMAAAMAEQMQDAGPAAPAREAPPRTLRGSH
jgi:hypothetical protein